MARRRSKGGRKRKDGPRTPSGQLSRAQKVLDERAEMNTKQIKEVATLARMKHTGLPEALASQPMAGSVLSLLLYDRRIIPSEYEAGKRYAELMARYYGLTGIPFPSARAQNIFAVGGHDGEESARRAALARKASDEVMKVEGALLGCTDGRMVKTKVHEVCVMDLMEARSWTPYTIGFVRRGLHSLIPVFGVDTRSAISA